MKAVVLRKFGSPEELLVEEVPQPTPGPDEALVRVKVCGICHLDLILRSGMRSRLKLPRILGHELAGEIVEVGSGVNDLAPGDHVASFNFQSCGCCEACRRGRSSLCRQSLGDIGQTRDGGYAEYAALPRANLVRIPDGLSFEHACLAACVYTPPYKALYRIGRVRPGDSVVVTGASGGLGTATIQIAHRFGARCIAITTSAAKVERLKALGADHVVVSADGAFGDEVRKITGGAGADIVVELVGSPTFHGSLRSLAPGGRCIMIGELHGKPVQLNLGLLIIKEWEIYGVQSASREDLEEVLRFMHESNLQLAIWKTISLGQVAEAHRALVNREIVGRILLRP